MNPELLGLGEVCVDWVAKIPHFPVPDEKIDAISEEIFMGGVTANFLSAASKLGVSTGFIGAVGDDDYGDFLLDGLAGKGIDTSLVKKRGDSPVNFIMVTRDTGEKAIIQSPHLQTTKLETQDIDLDYFAGAKLMHTTAIHPDLTMHCIEIAKQNDVLISLDLEKQVAVSEGESIKKIISEVDILLPNKAGAMEITKTKNVGDAARMLLEWGPKVILVTLGSKGALVTTSEMQAIIPPFDVSVVDTTGAGDAFCAGFLVSHVLKGYELLEAARIGNAVAALKIQHLGATSGQPTWQEVDIFIRSCEKKPSPLDGE